MIQINILKKGDEILAINEIFLAVKRKNGEVDIFNVLRTEDDEFSIDPIKKAVIGYGEGTLSKNLDDGETTIYSF